MRNLVIEKTINLPWSYSSYGIFKQCPKKYYHLKVIKDVKQESSTAMIYGKSVHSAAEHFVADGTPIPKKYEYIQKVMEKLRDREGDKHCEIKMGLTESGEPTGFSSKDAWYRCVADLLIVNGKDAVLIDYKTGKSTRFADTKQLDLQALCVFAHFPEIENIKAGLLFLVCNDIIKRDYTRSDIIGIMGEWTEKFSHLKIAYKEGIWNAKENFTCERYCPVVECTHNGRHLYHAICK